MRVQALKEAEKQKLKALTDQIRQVANSAKDHLHLQS